MSAIVQALIGQIIDPRRVAPGASVYRAAVVPGESLHELIGRTIGPPHGVPWRRSAPDATGAGVIEWVA